MANSYYQSVEDERDRMERLAETHVFVNREWLENMIQLVFELDEVGILCPDMEYCPIEGGKVANCFQCRMQAGLIEEVKIESS